MPHSSPPLPQLPAGSDSATPTRPPTQLWQCLAGAAIAATFTLLLYSITQGLANSFASHPLQTSNITAQNISVAVRTLVVGISTLGTGIFGITTVGLMGLAIQTGIQQLTAKNDRPL